MLQGSARAAAEAFLPLIVLIAAAPSEASRNFTRDRPARAKKFCRITTWSPGRTNCRLLQASSCPPPDGKLPRCNRETLLSRLLFSSIRECFGGDLVWRGQFHPNQLAHAALFHRY